MNFIRNNKFRMLILITILFIFQNSICQVNQNKDTLYFDSS